MQETNQVDGKMYSRKHYNIFIGRICIRRLVFYQIICLPLPNHLLLLVRSLLTAFRHLVARENETNQNNNKNTANEQAIRFLRYNLYFLTSSFRNRKSTNCRATSEYLRAIGSVSLTEQYHSWDGLQNVVNLLINLIQKRVIQLIWICPIPVENSKSGNHQRILQRYL